MVRERSLMPHNGWRMILSEKSSTFRRSCAGANSIWAAENPLRSAIRTSQRDFASHHSGCESPFFAHRRAQQHLGDTRARAGAGVAGQFVARKEARRGDLAVGRWRRALAKGLHHEAGDVI